MYNLQNSLGVFLFVNLQLCQLAEFHEITGFAIRVHEDNKRLLRIKLQEGKVHVTLLDNGIFLVIKEAVTKCDLRNAKQYDSLN